MTSHKQESQEMFASVNNFFNERGDVYQKVLTNNYMKHREIYDLLHKFFVNYFHKPFKMLDLGCGDARFVAQSLLNTNIASYQGIDLAEASLEIACNNMACIPGEKTFSHGDIVSVVSQLEPSQPNSFDIILASFSLHHLNIEQKNRIIGQILQLLKANGVFILVDAVRREGENRETYIKRYLDNVNRDWQLLSKQEILMVETHISNNDFPETRETLDSIARKHGFLRVECLYRDPLDTSQLLCFYS
jgi:ubiquinone/menaquinone biosynthesis C-methylase UbiE